MAQAVTRSAQSNSQDSDGVAGEFRGRWGDVPAWDSEAGQRERVWKNPGNCGLLDSVFGY